VKHGAIAGLLFALTSLVFAGEAQQICEPSVLETVGAYLGRADFKPVSAGGDVVAAACKAWPHNGDLVFAFAYGASDPPDHFRQFVLGTLNKKDGQIRALFQRAIQEDAVLEFGEESLRIDTARYQLSKNRRAIGVRIYSAAQRMGCTEGWMGNSLLLFVPDEKELRFVYGLFTYVERYLFGANCGASTASKYEDANIVLGVEETEHAGYADLTLTARISVDGWDDNGAKDYSAENRVEHQYLRYSPNVYQPLGEPKWWLVDDWNFPLQSPR